MNLGQWLRDRPLNTGSGEPTKWVGGGVASEVLPLQKKGVGGKGLSHAESAGGGGGRNKFLR